MDNVGVRYAGALYSLAKDDNEIIQYQLAMKSLYIAIMENKEILTFLSSSFVVKTEKYEIVSLLCSSFDLRHLYPFFKVLVDNHRVNDFVSIYRNFNSMANDYQNIEEGFIYSTIPLHESKIREIESALEKQSKKQVELINRIDESLIGGIKVIIHDRVYDASIKNKINSLKSELIENR